MTGLLHSASRVYDPGLGRWISEDTIQAPNLYTYVGNSFPNAIDPTGLSAQGNPLNNLYGSFDAYAGGYSGGRVSNPPPPVYVSPTLNYNPLAAPTYSAQQLFGGVKSLKIASLKTCYQSRAMTVATLFAIPLSEATLARLSFGTVIKKLRNQLTTTSITSPTVSRSSWRVFKKALNHERFGYFLYGTGKFFDATTGLQYNNARWHDPATGKFINEDPARDGSNWYSYAGNDPINFYDPTRLSRTRNPPSSLSVRSMQTREYAALAGGGIA